LHCSETHHIHCIKGGGAHGPHNAPSNACRPRRTHAWVHVHGLHLLPGLRARAMHMRVGHAAPRLAGAQGARSMHRSVRARAANRERHHAHRHTVTPSQRHTVTLSHRLSSRAHACAVAGCRRPFWCGHQRTSFTVPEARAQHCITHAQHHVTPSSHHHTSHCHITPVMAPAGLSVKLLRRELSACKCDDAGNDQLQVCS
jgi:hypothetical protein